MNKMKFEVVLSHAPYPRECWWRIVGANGRIIHSSELMGKRNAQKMIVKLIEAIKSNKYVVREVVDKKS